MGKHHDTARMDAATLAERLGSFAADLAFATEAAKRLGAFDDPHGAGGWARHLRDSADAAINGCDGAPDTDPRVYAWRKSRTLASTVEDATQDTATALALLDRALARLRNSEPVAREVAALYSDLDA